MYESCCHCHSVASDYDYVPFTDSVRTSLLCACSVIFLIAVWFFFCLCDFQIRNFRILLQGETKFYLSDDFHVFNWCDVGMDFFLKFLQSINTSVTVLFSFGVSRRPPLENYLAVAGRCRQHHWILCLQHSQRGARRDLNNSASAIQCCSSMFLYINKYTICTE